MKKIIFIVAVAALLVSLINLPLIRWVLGPNDCEFSNSDGSFTFAEMNFKGTNYQQCKEVFIEFKKRRLGDTTLYRLCPMNIFHFWDYGDYMFAQKYRVPYKSWTEIENHRGPLGNRSGFQDF
jgi:hypothetical protein